MEYSKFSVAEIIIGLPFLILIDGLAALLDLIPVLGKVLATLIQAAVSFGTTFWFMGKGGKKATSMERQLMKQFANVLPFIPTLTIGFIAEVALHNNPQLAEKARKAVGVARKVVTKGLVAVVIGLTLIVPTAHAQESLNLILTWQADNFYPSNYPMKAAATPNSPLTISLAALEDGRFIDLSRDEIVWYRDGKYLSNGVGLKQVSFDVNWRITPPGSEYSIRALVYRSTGIVEAATLIPVEQQDVVLDIPRFGQAAPPGSATAITAIPFFFNVDDFGSLRFEWNVEDAERSEKTEENVLVLNVETPQTTRQYVPVGVRVTNILGLIEWAEKRVNVLIQ